LRRMNLTIVAGVLAALVGALLVLSYGKNVDEKIAEGRELVDVLVAAEDLDGGTPATELAVRTEQIADAYVSEGAVSDISEVTGLVLAAQVPSGTQLTAGMFATQAAGTTVRPSEGHVAISVQVNLAAGVARYLSVGDFVDVYATYERIQDAPIASNRSKLILSGVRVLSVSLAPSAATEETGAVDAGLPADQTMVVLEVLPRQGESLVNAATLGFVHLGLITEGETHSTPAGVNPDDVVGRGGSR
jgi:pilus assembly protein CpaB